MLGREGSSFGRPWENQPLPESLTGIPRSAITPEALDAAREGRTPFGPAPLIERRSGVDRRSGIDRRHATELVFRNNRYGGSRRVGSERRAQVPPVRPKDMSVAESIGNQQLKQHGWMPASLKEKTKH